MLAMNLTEQMTDPLTGYCMVVANLILIDHNQ